MSRIQILSDLLVNKIAAGEVIERPASIVKELVENALDAGSTHVSVTIEDGGKRLIRVVDDGIGMSAEDLRLAVTPHATSKITCEDDLFKIATLGFRGEALASIGAVSHLRITSRTRDEIEGNEIVVSAKHLETTQAAGCRVGTSVEVRDLFFNVPARRKFMRATPTEVGHINEQVARTALGHRSVGFELTNNQRTTHRLAADSTIQERIGALYGADLADELIPIERDERGMRIEGYVAPPARSRSTASWQYVFLNGRYIRDRSVQHAIREAYRGLMEHQRFPVAFLFLTMDPELVDVNVHPSKLEVRWQNSQMVHSQILSALRDKFLTTNLAPALRAGESDSRVRTEIDPARSAEVRRDAAEYYKGLTPSPMGAPIQARYEGGGYSPTLGTPPSTSPADIRSDVWDSMHGSGVQDGHASRMPSDDSPGELPQIKGYRALQVHNSYLVAETSEGLVIIDQHALHERIMYEKLKAQITDGPLESQRLLMPETLTASATDMALLQEHESLLTKLGVEANAFGEDQIAVHAFPSLLKDIDAAAFMRDLLDRLGEQHAQTSAEEVIHEVLDMMSCKAAVKAGDSLTTEEIATLIDKKGEIEKSSNCPHGRPTTLSLSVDELEKQFKRK
ncbi:MAG: DNA mismatch repair protein MutL [Phycisphaerae bacterium]|nr:MAG: DNA mismatch repair protein MutL [Phycisphaerae bacterium]